MNSAVQRLFQPYSSSGNIPADMPLYTSAARQQPRTNARPYQAKAGSMDGLSDDSERMGTFQRGRNMTISSSHPAAMETRNVNAVKTGRNYTVEVMTELLTSLCSKFTHIVDGDFNKSFLSVISNEKHFATFKKNFF